MGRLDIEDDKMPFALIWYNVRPEDPTNRQRIKYIIIQRYKKDDMECALGDSKRFSSSDKCVNETKLFKTPTSFILNKNSFSCVAHTKHLIYLDCDYGDKIIYNEHDTFIEFFNEENDIHVEVL